jgi:hypothetical protein
MAQNFILSGIQKNEIALANYQSFFGDLCRAIGVEEPPPKGSVAGDPYCFDKDIKFIAYRIMDYID